MHEAAFELIEIPHVRQSGKNSADIRMVVDALDLCYTKSHVDTFVIISGDSDFSPLVSKLRENNKTVIGVGVKNSTSDLLIANCDEFIFYDDLVREKAKETAPQKRRRPRPPGRGRPSRRQEEADKKQEALDLVVETVEALFAERGDEEKIWGSMVKQALKRRKPGLQRVVITASARSASCWMKPSPGTAHAGTATRNPAASSSAVSIPIIERGPDHAV